MAKLQYTGRQYIITVPPYIIESVGWKIGAEINFKYLILKGKSIIIMSEEKINSPNLIDQIRDIIGDTI